MFIGPIFLDMLWHLFPNYLLTWQVVTQEMNGIKLYMVGFWFLHSGIILIFPILVFFATLYRPCQQHPSQILVIAYFGLINVENLVVLKMVVRIAELPQYSHGTRAQLPSGVRLYTRPFPPGKTVLCGSGWSMICLSVARVPSTKSGGSQWGEVERFCETTRNYDKTDFRNDEKIQPNALVYV